MLLKFVVLGLDDWFKSESNLWDLLLAEEKELSKRIPKDEKEVMESLYKKLHSLKKKKFKLKKPEGKVEVNGNV